MFYLTRTELNPEGSTISSLRINSCNTKNEASDALVALASSIAQQVISCKSSIAVIFRNERVEVTYKNGNRTIIAIEI